MAPSSVVRDIKEETKPGPPAPRLSVSQLPGGMTGVQCLSFLAVKKEIPVSGRLSHKVA